jgi:hypothetical protein
MTERQEEADRERLEKLPEHEIDEGDDTGTLDAPPAAPGTLAQGGTVVGDPTPRPDPMTDEAEVDEDTDRVIPPDPTRATPADQVRR